ncbi:MAG: hypothetical protein ACJ8F1_08035 [Polyangia bacterium]
MRRPGLPFASLVLGFHAEPQAQDPPGVGLAAMHGRHHDHIPNALQRGVWRDVTRGGDRYEETVSMFSSQLSQGFRLLDDGTGTLSVRWPSPSFDRWLELATLASGIPAERAQRAFATKLWNGHPYTGRATREQLHQIASTQILSWLKRVRRPANGALVIVGDIDPAAASREAAESLGDWTGDPTPPPAPPVPPVPMSRSALPGEPALTRARWRVARRSARGGWTNASLAHWLFRAWNAGLPLASLDGLPQDLAGVTLADVAGVLGACRASAVVSVLGPDPRATPQP